MKTIHFTLAALAASAPGLMAFPFATPQTVRADYGRVAAVADFNRDGRADILMASSSELVWMRQTSGTSFTQATVRTWAGWTLDEVRTADMDGDGDTDVVVNMAAPPRLLILRNDGNFAFTNVLDSPVGTTALPAGAIVGDYDNDGDMDAGMFHTVAGETPRRITWADNDGGTFTLNPVTQNVASIDWVKAVAADFDQDGRMDVARGLTNVDTIRGTASGVFLPWPTVTFSGVISHMEAGDIDGDNRLDLVLTSGGAPGTAQRAAWCRFNGSGFDALQTIQSHTSGRVRSTHLMDVDEDGDLDAVYGDQAFFVDAANQAPLQITWAENSGSGFLIPKVLLDATDATEINSGDVDGDGDEDLVFSANGDVQVVANTAIHRTAEFSSVTAGIAAGSVGDICTADLHDDGRVEVIWTVPSTNRIEFNNGIVAGGAFVNMIAGPGAVAAGDMNHDGRTDLVVASGGDGQIKMLSRNSSDAWSSSNIFPLPAGTQELEVADVNRDGDNDILIGHATGVTLLTGNGFSTWTEWTVANNIGPVTNIRAIQLNGTGWLEVLSMTVETSPQRCRIYRSAFGTFGWLTPPPLSEGNCDSSLLATGDANRDGGSDIFYAVGSNLNCAPSSLTSVTPGTPKSVANVGGFRCAETADFNRDGTTDLAIAGGPGVWMYLGRGDGTFFPSETVFFKAGANLTRMAVMDFERDGDVDIVVLDEAADEVQILRNHCGQFDLTEFGMGDVITTAASAAPVAMHLTFTHAGRAGDVPATIRSLRFRLLKGDINSQGEIIPGAGLTTAEATALLSAVEVYNDAGEPMNFESGTDAQLGTVGPATSIGYLTVTPTTPITLNVSQTVRLWVRPRMSANAGSSAIRSFFLQHITDPAAGGTNVTHSTGSTASHRLDPMLIEEGSVRLLLPGALENWRFTHWGQHAGTGDAANDADPDGDGVPNLVEYVMNRDPKGVPLINPFAPPVVVSYNGQLRAEFTLLDNYDSRVRLTLQATTNLQNWTTLSTRTGTGAWTGSIIPAATPLPAFSLTRFNFATGANPTTQPKFYVRLKAEELP